MYYKILSQKYFRDAEILKSYIKNLKNQHADIISDTHNDVYYRITTLYAMYLDLKHTAEYLHRKSEVMKNEK